MFKLLLDNEPNDLRMCCAYEYFTEVFPHAKSINKKSKLMEI